VGYPAGHLGGKAIILSKTNTPKNMTQYIKLIPRYWVAELETFEPRVVFGALVLGFFHYSEEPKNLKLSNVNEIHTFSPTVQKESPDSSSRLKAHNSWLVPPPLPLLRSVPWGEQSFSLCWKLFPESTAFVLPLLRRGGGGRTQWQRRMGRTVKATC
jgi:hypothetical protein